MSFCRGCGTALHKPPPASPALRFAPNLPRPSPRHTLDCVPALIVGILALLAAIGFRRLPALIDPGSEYMGTLLFAASPSSWVPLAPTSRKKAGACLLPDWYWAAGIAHQLRRLKKELIALIFNSFSWLKANKTIKSKRYKLLFLR